MKRPLLYFPSGPAFSHWPDLMTAFGYYAGWFVSITFVKSDEKIFKILLLPGRSNCARWFFFFFCSIGATLKMPLGKLMEVAKPSDETSKQLRKEILTCGGGLVLSSGIVYNQRQTSKTLAGVITSGLHAAAGKTPSDPHNASKCWCNVALIAACCLLRLAGVSHLQGQPASQPASVAGKALRLKIKAVSKSFDPSVAWLFKI